MSSQTCSYDLPVRRRGPKGVGSRAQPRTPQRHLLARVDEEDGEDELTTSETDGQDSVRKTPYEHSMVWKLRRELIVSVGAELPSVPITQVVDDCISVFFQRSFPTLPICHEPSLRTHAQYFFGPAGHSESSEPNGGPDRGSVQLMRSFALLTALCAATALVHQGTFVPYGATVGPLFFFASRRIHKEYDDYDLQNPDSTSLQIRMLFSTCFQLHKGESGLAWHAVAQAGLLACGMRLYSEHTIRKFDPLESTLLRFGFWTLYMADCASICLGNRAVVLHEPLFDTDMDIEAFGSNHVPLIAQDGVENSLLQGFHTIRLNWHLASKVILAIRSCTRCHWKENQPLIQQAELAKVTQTYSEFIASLDEIPFSLQSPASSAFNDAAGSRYDITSSYVSQRFRLLSTYYFSKLMIIYNCVRYGLTAAIGLRDEESTHTVDVINAAREFIHNLQSVPFHYVQGSGEPCAEFVRGVGSILLKISQDSTSNPNRDRANLLLNFVLNFLARIDSRTPNKIVEHIS